VQTQASPFLTLIAPHLPPALEQIGVPAYVLDSAGLIRWLNPAAKEIVGDAVGRPFSAVVDPTDIPRARARFAEDLRSSGNNEFALDLLGADGGEVRVEISSVALRSRHRAIGIFGVVRTRQDGAARPARLDGRLTPRQHDVLLELADGASTDQIAERLHLSRETVRNHVRHILMRLHATSRLEAVAIARREEIL
jgi:PAS domain S-box-containing protein